MAYLDDALEMHESEGKGSARHFISEEIEHLLPIFALTAGDRTAPYGINKWFATGLLRCNVLAQELPFARAERVVFFDARRWYLRGGAMLMCGRGTAALVALLVRIAGGVAGAGVRAVAVAVDVVLALAGVVAGAVAVVVAVGYTVLRGRQNPDLGLSPGSPFSLHSSY